ncbi:hypothetical protein LJ737_18940 [Hymenobacter sp. 15J16-1T3B]|uniref:hypothetical protein n=1 Tax=Hymenobacter sp. 15J16-1T3B TaxID=2886941 RepID=UPI001D12FE49|nr:hypothetical protein [Hymenobacter sp. 15J16-1T3B]MCC3159326.1 hypothetical protein [Hymenobacter sp. 15J16-1T3B]
MKSTFQHRLGLLLLVTGSLAATPALAQQTPAGSQPANYNKTNITPGEFQAYNTFDYRYEGLVGTPYLQKGWTQAKVTLADKRQLTGAPARYDVYRRVLVVQPYANKKDSVWLDASRMHEFTLLSPLPGQPERHFVPFAEAPEAEKRTAFVEELYRGPSGYALLKLPRKVMVKANYQGAYAADRRFDELVDRTEYYLRRPDGSAVEVKLTQKSIAGAAPALTALGQSKRNVKTEQDAVELLRSADAAK